MSVHGWLILDKPHGLGSTNAVGAVKRALRDGGLGKVKVGHGGTLDPLATGVLPIALGEATKLAGRMLDASTVYDFTIRFGVETDTLDAEGASVATSVMRPSHAAVTAVLPRFTGPIEQLPPAYSALKVDGARAYDLARAGQVVTLAARAVTVFELSVRAAFPGVALDEVTLTAHVSKGTYIRSLARDIAQALGTVGHVSMLRRTRAGPFDLASAISLDILRAAATGQGVERLVLPLEAALDGIPALPLTSAQATLLRQGRVLDGIAASDGAWLATDAGRPVALVEAEAGFVRVQRRFNL